VREEEIQEQTGKGLCVYVCVCVYLCTRPCPPIAHEFARSRRRKAAEMERQLKKKKKIGIAEGASRREDVATCENLDGSRSMYHGVPLSRKREKSTIDRRCPPSSLATPRVRYRPAITRRVDPFERYRVTRVAALVS